MGNEAMWIVGMLLATPPWAQVGEGLHGLFAQIVGLVLIIGWTFTL